MKSLRQIDLIFLFVLSMGPAWASAFAKGDSAPISFGVVPQQSASTLARIWNPLLDYLSQQTGRRIVFRTAPDIPTFEQRLASGEYDIAYMNPYHYTIFSREPGYRVFAKERNRQIKGILVVRKESKLQTLDQLADLTLAFPSPAAFAASLLPRAHLKQQDIPFSVKYVTSHDSVYRAVAKGLYPAGGGVIRTFNSVVPQVREQLRVLWTTPGYTAHAIAAHPRLVPQLVQTIAAALFSVDHSSKEGDLLTPLNMQGFEAAEDRQWDDVRELNIDLPLGK
ncbi:MAG: phosphate/phosphite/phosphonate ABC transporter substrate-binding protein [Candidatus Thiodiazotropha sp.]